MILARLRDGLSLLKGGLFVSPMRRSFIERQVLVKRTSFAWAVIESCHVAFNRSVSNC